MASVKDPIGDDRQIVVLRGAPLYDRRLLFRDPVYASPEAIVRRYGDKTIY